MHHGDPGEIVEKTMSFTRTEFEAGLTRLMGGPPGTDGPTRYVLSWKSDAEHAITVEFDPQPDAVLGGLVKLPRVRVVLYLQELTPAEREDFQTRFDRTFQRGGG